MFFQYSSQILPGFMHLSFKNDRALRNRRPGLNNGADPEVVDVRLYTGSSLLRDEANISTRGLYQSSCKA